VASDTPAARATSARVALWRDRRTSPPGAGQAERRSGSGGGLHRGQTILDGPRTPLGRNVRAPLGRGVPQAQRPAPLGAASLRRNFGATVVSRAPEGAVLAKLRGAWRSETPVRHIEMGRYTHACPRGVTES